MFVFSEGGKSLNENSARGRKENEKMDVGVCVYTIALSAHMRKHMCVHKGFDVDFDVCTFFPRVRALNLCACAGFKMLSVHFEYAMGDTVNV